MEITVPGLFPDVDVNIWRATSCVPRNANDVSKKHSPERFLEIKTKTRILKKAAMKSAARKKQNNKN